jgi:hypothetical protein
LAKPKGGTGGTKLPMELRRKKVMEYKLQRWTSQQIADELDISVHTITKDLAHCKAIWREEFKRDNDLAVHEELANLNNLEFILHQSLQGRTDPVEVSTLTARLMRISEQRSKLLGIEMTPQRNLADKLPEYHSNEPIKLKLEIIAPGNRVEVEPDEEDEDDLDDEDLES